MKLTCLLGLCLIISACAGKNGSSAGDTATAVPIGDPPPLTAVDELNNLANLPAINITIQFNPVEQAGVTGNLEVPCICPNNATCACPALALAEVARIAGLGSIVNSPVAEIDALIMAVTYNPEILNGETCLDQAEDAIIYGNSLTIVGTATLVPLPWAQGVDSPGSANLGGASAQVPSPVTINYGQLYGEATQVSQGLISTPIFIQPWVGILLTSISSCYEGETSQPNPVPILSGAGSSYSDGSVSP